MYEGIHEAGRYYLRPIDIDYSHLVYEMTREQFHDWLQRWQAPAEIILDKNDYRVL